MSVAVVGVDGGPLAPAAVQVLERADLVVGSPGQVAALGAPAGATVVASGDVHESVQLLHGQGGAAVLLASGDPGLFGVLRLVRESGLSPQVFPAVSSVSAAFARAGLPWDDAVVVSAHGRDLRRAVHVCLAVPKTAVLTGPGAGPAELGRALALVPGAPPRRLFVARELGGSAEQCEWLAPAEAAGRDWPGRSVVLCVQEDRSVGAAAGWLLGGRPPLAWALPEPEFEHRDGQLTKAEVRALALARLAPGLGRLVWDIGTGSGSVAVECARLGSAVVAVDQAGVELPLRNAARHAVSLCAVTGRAPEVLAGLPDPDAVFVGGGGAYVARIVAAAVSRGPEVVVVALAALDRVGAVRAALAPYRVDGVQLSAARLRDLAGGAGLAAQNPVLLLWGYR